MLPWCHQVIFPFSKRCVDNTQHKLDWFDCFNNEAFRKLQLISQICLICFIFLPIIANLIATTGGVIVTEAIRTFQNFMNINIKMIKQLTVTIFLSKQPIKGPKMNVQMKLSLLPKRSWLWLWYSLCITHIYIRKCYQGSDHQLGLTTIIRPATWIEYFGCTTVTKMCHIRSVLGGTWATTQITTGWMTHPSWLKRLENFN